MSVTVTATFTDDDLKTEITQLRSELMSLKDELKAEIQTLKDSAATEHEQHLAILAALEAKIQMSLTPAEWDEIKADFADARVAMTGIVPDALVEEPPPAPEPLPE